MSSPQRSSDSTPVVARKVSDTSLIVLASKRGAHMLTGSPGTAVRAKSDKAKRARDSLAYVRVSCSVQSTPESELLFAQSCWSTGEAFAGSIGTSSGG
jgi:hypothetical protein